MIVLAAASLNLLLQINSNAIFLDSSVKEEFLIFSITSFETSHFSNANLNISVSAFICATLIVQYKAKDDTSIHNNIFIKVGLFSISSKNLINQCLSFHQNLSFFKKQLFTNHSVIISISSKLNFLNSSINSLFFVDFLASFKSSLSIVFIQYSKPNNSFHKS
jgi:hypothetical protein